MTFYRFLTIILILVLLIFSCSQQKEPKMMNAPKTDILSEDRKNDIIDSTVFDRRIKKEKSLSNLKNDKSESLTYPAGGSPASIDQQDEKELLRRDSILKEHRNERKSRYRLQKKLISEFLNLDEEFENLNVIERYKDEFVELRMLAMKLENKSTFDSSIEERRKENQSLEIEIDRFIDEIRKDGVRNIAKDTGEPYTTESREDGYNDIERKKQLIKGKIAYSQH